jgi:hypothetical protein
MVTIEVIGVLDAHAVAMALDELAVVCGVAEAVTLDLGAVDKLRVNACPREFLEEARSRCRLASCRLWVIASQHSALLRVLQWWENESNGGWRAG